MAAGGRRTTWWVAAVVVAIPLLLCGGCIGMTVAVCGEWWHTDERDLVWPPPSGMAVVRDDSGCGGGSQQSCWYSVIVRPADTENRLQSVVNAYRDRGYDFQRVAPGVATFQAPWPGNDEGEFFISERLDNLTPTGEVEVLARRNLAC